MFVGVPTWEVVVEIKFLAQQQFLDPAPCEDPEVLPAI